MPTASTSPRWAPCLGLDPDFGLGAGICRVRLLHYWRVRDCRELFCSSPPFAAVFGAPGLVAELVVPGDAGWREAAIRLARLPRREWMERLGLPPTRQVVRLFSRLQPWLVAARLPHVREVFADADARKRLSDTTCTIPDYLLEYFRHSPILRWPLMRSFCRRGRSPHSVVSGVMEQMAFFCAEPICGRRLIRSRWLGLSRPGAAEALGRVPPPVPESGTIRHIKRPDELLSLSAAHDLCLERLIEPIIRGEYALYRVDHLGQFAVAGIKRGDDGVWTLEEIRGARNSEVCEELKKHFLGWLEPLLNPWGRCQSLFKQGPEAVKKGLIEAAEGRMKSRGSFGRTGRPSDWPVY